MGQKKKWSAAEKFEIALKAIRNETTLNEICKQYEVAASQVHAWKKQLLTQGAELFGKPDKAALVAVAEQEKLQRHLYEKVGQLTMERDFLKKSLGKFPGTRGEN
jgi:transposase